VKATKATIGRAVDQPAATIRFYLFHGQDEAQSRSVAARLVESLGATKTAMSSASVKADPGSLVDAARAMSLFGGKQLVWIEPATRDIEAGIVALLEGPDVESAVVAVAGALPKTSPLIKLAEASPNSLAFQAYPLEGQEAERMVVDIGRRFGLKLSSPVAARIAEAAGNDQAVAAQELQKLALYVDASPQSPRDLDHGAIDEVGAECADGNFLRLADLALGGEVDQLSDELARLPPGGNEGIPVVRSLQRRLLLLAPARARMERGEGIDAVMASLGRAVFFKEKIKVQRMLAKWSADNLATVAQRAGELERALIFSAAPERETLGEELLAIARKARSL
jgi:DNA polymerase-3 subunit delta